MDDPSSRRPDNSDRTVVIAELRALIEEGIASGVTDMTFEDVIAEARAEVDANEASLPSVARCLRRLV